MTLIIFAGIKKHQKTIKKHKNYSLKAFKKLLF